MSQILEQADGLLQALPKEQLGTFPDSILPSGSSVKRTGC